MAGSHARLPAVYATILLSDEYLPGAMVLAHSLRDAGTNARLAILVADLRDDTIAELQTLYDDIIPISRTINHNASRSNLYLMHRPDLDTTLSKIELWRQTQYSQIVYLDCDVISLRAPDELLTMDTQFAAAPDVGWPDCFNSGVLVLRPSKREYYSLLAQAERGVSFDGADQGLLNIHFRKWDRLSFSYNCTPNGHYQYLPAFRYFESSISIVHFIGSQKPWMLGRNHTAGAVYDELLGHWWSVYDRHFRAEESIEHQSSNFLTGGLVKSVEYSSYTDQSLSSEHALLSAGDHHDSPDFAYSRYHLPESAVVPYRKPDFGTSYHSFIPPELPLRANQPRTEDLHFDAGFQQPVPHHPDVLLPPLSVTPKYVAGEKQTILRRPPTSMRRIKSQKSPRPPSMAPTSSDFRVWDAASTPPPVDSKPEAFNLPSRIYSMSSDTTLFTPPAPSSPPKNFFYQVPSTPPQMKPTHAIFPWESSASKPSRVFDEGPPLASPPKFARPKDMWNSFQQQPTANEWDKLPAINRYVRQLQGPPPRPGGRRKATSTPVLVSSLKSKNPPTPCGADAGLTQGYQPTAPKKRVSWPDSSVDSSATSPVTSEHHIRDTSAATSPTTSPNFFPPAAGVPSQEEWDPTAQLDRLARASCQLLRHVQNVQSREQWGAFREAGRTQPAKEIATLGEKFSSLPMALPIAEAGDSGR